MAYRRRQGITRATTFKEENHHPPVIKTFSSSSSFSYTPSTPNASSAANSLAVQAIRASAHKTSHSASEIDFHPKSPRSKEFNAYEKAGNDSKGFWGVIARKAKAIIEDDNMSPPSKTPVSRVSPLNTLDASTASQSQQPTDQGFRRMDNPAIRRGLDKITSSLNQIGDTFEKAFEEGRTIVENKAQDIKIHIRRKGGNPMEQDQVTGFNSSSDKLLQVQKQGNQENQLKASRDVAMATAAKAKLLLRELKTIKADLAFAKERCAQLEEENKLLRENREKGAFPGDDDLIRLQLETLLAEKARLAHENSVYTRENRFLREIVEYHQLTMQDVVYFDEGAEEVTEVCPLRLPFTKIFQDVTTFSPLSPLSPCSSPAAPLTDETLPLHGIPEEVKEDESESDVRPSSTATSAAPVEEEARTNPPAPVEEEARTNPPTSSV